MRRVMLTTVVVTALLGGCSGGTKDIFGRGKSSPDEFAVYARAPLSLPPGYGQRPGAQMPLPAPGTAAERAALVLPQDEARAAMLGNRGTGPTAGGGSAVTMPAAAGSSPGTMALLRRTGALNATPDIRATVNRETQLLAEADQTFVERLMFWRTPVAYGTVVDASAEARRIQEAQALGEPIVAGQTPTIERKRKALLEGIFDGIF